MFTVIRIYRDRRGEPTIEDTSQRPESPMDVELLEDIAVLRAQLRRGLKVDAFRFPVILSAELDTRGVRESLEFLPYFCFVEQIIRAWPWSVFRCAP